MNENVLGMLSKLSLNKETASAVLPMIGKFGLAGLVALARGYLGPLASRACPTGTTGNCTTGAGGTGTGDPGKGQSGAQTAGDQTGGSQTGGDQGGGDQTGGGLSPCDQAVLGLALHKLIFELGELALFNPTLDANGKQPEFTLDENGHPPAMSVTHVLASIRFVQQRAAQRDANQQAQQTAVVVRSPRLQLQAARTQRYASAPRYSYGSVATYRAPR